MISAAGRRARIVHHSLSMFSGLLMAAIFPLALPAQDTPAQTIDQECMALAYAPDGRLAYAVRNIIKTRHLEIQRDDIWLLGLDGKRRRIVAGEKLVRGPAAFSYAVQALRWSPDGTRLTADLATSQMINERGDTQEGTLVLLLDQEGKEIKIAGADSAIPEAYHGAWLGDGVTVAYLTEALKPKLLYSINTVRPVAGRGRPIFTDRAYAAVDWYSKQGLAVAVERDRTLTGKPRLVLLDLLKEDRRELATLDMFAGSLTVSPSGTKVAYFLDQEILEIRELNAPERVARIHVLYGDLEWSPGERRILLKRGPERRSGDLAWLTVPPFAAPATGSQSAEASLRPAEVLPEPALRGLTFRDFALSPDGRFLAVVQPGKRNILIYPVR